MWVSREAVLLGSALLMLGMANPVAAQHRADRVAPAAPKVTITSGLVASATPATSMTIPVGIRGLQRQSKNCQWIGPSDDAGPCAWRDHFGPRLLPPTGLERAMLTGVEWFASPSATTAERQGAGAQVQLMHRAMEATRAKIDADFRSAIKRRP